MDKEINLSVGKKNNCLEAVVILGLSALIFLYLFGYHILNPFDYKWLFRNFDDAQTQLGWMFFQRQPWSWPLGELYGYISPQLSSIVYACTIPLFSLIFKFLTRLFGFYTPIQYVGIWLLLCYLLQGLMASYLLRHFTKNNITILLGSLFFLISPILFARFSIGQAFLAAHWLILAGLCLYFKSDEHLNAVKWISIILIASLVHAYLLFMVLLLWVSNLLKYLIVNRGRAAVQNIVMHGLVTMIFLLFTLWLAGYFVPVGSIGAGGFGYYSMNLNALFNPEFATSPFLDTLPYGAGQYEGFNYLGLGTILLAFIAVVVIFYSGRQRVGLPNIKHVPLILICIFLLLFALSNQVYLGHYHLASLWFPASLGNAFRSTGRMFWPVYYLILLGLILFTAKLNNRAYLVNSILTLCFCINLADFNSFFIHNRIAYPYPESTDLTLSSAWKGLAQHYPKFTYPSFPILLAEDIGPLRMSSLEALAAIHHNNIDFGRLARWDIKKIMQHTHKTVKNLRQENLRPDTLYIFGTCQYCYSDFLDKSKYIAGVLDQYVIIAPRYQQDILGLKPWPISLVKNGHATSLAEITKQYSKKDYLIIFTAKDDAAAHIPKDFVAAMQQKGSHLDQLLFRGSYIGIIQDGRLIQEHIDNKAAIATHLAVANKEIQVNSAGNEFGDYAHIIIDGVEYSLNKRGLNVMVINTKNSQGHLFNFDTFALQKS